jgi:Tol biopolymer transport system component
LWSPDGWYLAFTADNKLKKVDVENGSVQIITELNGPVRAYGWNRDGVILVGVDSIVARVSDDGGIFQPVTQLDISRKERSHGPAALLPDGHHFLYIVFSLKPEHSGLFVGSIDSETSQRIMPTEPLSGLAYSDGYLLISLQRFGPLIAGGFTGMGVEPTGTLTAQRFDPTRFALEGQPFPIAEVESAFSISDTGVLVYRNGVAAPTMKQLLWFDRDGRQVGQVGANANYGNVDLSPSADRVAVDINTNGNRDVWVIDIARGVSSRITFDPGADWSSSWSPDGTQLIFGSTRQAGTHMYEKSSSGAGTEKLVFNSDKIEIPVSWSHDGTHVAFSRPRAGGMPVYDTWVLDMSSSTPKATPFVESPFDKVQARISPDGRWIVYTTNDSGMYQIVVQSFPDPNGGKWQITSQGGVEPKWRHDGRELYYLAFDGKLMAVPVKGDRTFEAGTPTPLFETPLSVSRTFASRDRRYDVAPDGRFLMAVPTANNGPAPAEVVVNWAAGLPRK